MNDTKLEKTGRIPGIGAATDRRPFRRRQFRMLCYAACLLGIAMGATVAQPNEEEARKRDLARKEAVILWVGLGILSVFSAGVGLIWGVSRARRLLRKRKPVHTVMPNIWYLNPPGKRRQDDS